MKRLIVALALLVSMMVPLSIVASPASAVTGCNSNVQDKADSWGQNVFYPTYSRIPTYKEIRLVGTAVYQWCPNGSAVDKLRVKWIQWCYTHIDDRSINFDGVKFNGYYFDDDTTSNPPIVKVDDDGTVQNCKTQDIPYSSEAWLRMDQSPGWTISSWVVLQGFPDKHNDFKWDGKTYKYFHPSDDVVVKDWYS